MLRTHISRNPSFPFPFLRISYSSASNTQSLHPVADYLITRHQFSLPTASRVSSQIPHFQTFHKSDSILNWFKQIGFSQTQLESLLSRVPHMLSSNLDKTLKPKYLIFQELGFPETDIVDIIAIDPWMMVKRAASRISTSLAALMSVLGTVEDVSRALRICTWFLKTDLDKNLLVNIGFLQGECGVRKEQIRRFVFSFPRLLLWPPEFIRSVVRRVDEMGFGDRRSGMFLHAVRVVASLKVESWEAKVGVFRSLGLSEEEISDIFRRVPQVFASSERKIREVVGLLVGSGKGDMGLIVRHPGLLLLSAENRIRPRMELVDELEARGLILRRPGLSSLIKCSKRDFLGKFVLPYSDVLGDTCLVEKLY